MKIDAKKLYFGRTQEKDFRWLYYDSRISQKELDIISSDYTEYENNLFLRELSNNIIAVYTMVKAPFNDFRGRDFNIIIGYFIDSKYVNYKSLDFLKIIYKQIKMPDKIERDSIEKMEKKLLIIVDENNDNTFFDSLKVDNFDSIHIYKNEDKVFYKHLVTNDKKENEELEKLDKQILKEKNKRFKNSSKLIELYEKRIQLVKMINNLE